MMNDSALAQIATARSPEWLVHSSQHQRLTSINSQWGPYSWPAGGWRVHHGEEFRSGCCDCFHGRMDWGHWRLPALTDSASCWRKMPCSLVYPIWEVHQNNQILIKKNHLLGFTSFCNTPNLWQVHYEVVKIIFLMQCNHLF